MTIPHRRKWHSDNLDVSHFTDAGNPVVPPDVYMRGMACAAPDEPETRQDGLWLGCLIVCIALAAGILIGWLAAGIGR